MTSDHEPNPNGFPGQPYKRPTPRPKGPSPRGDEQPGPLPMGPPPGAVPSPGPVGPPQPLPGQPAPAPMAPQPGVAPVPAPPGAVPGPPATAVPSGAVAPQISTGPPAPLAAPAPVVQSQVDEDRASRAALTPLLVATGACLLLAAIGLVAFFAIRDRGDRRGHQTAMARARQPGLVKTAVSEGRAADEPARPRVVDRIDSDLERVPLAIDRNDVLDRAERGELDEATGRPGSVGGAAVIRGDEVFDGRMPDADDLDGDAADLPDGSGESGSDEPEAPAEEPGAEEPAVERPEPFTEMPDRVALPSLAASADQAQPTVLGAVHKLESDEMTFALVGAREALGGEGRFAIERDEEPDAARVLLSAHGQAPVAAARFFLTDEALNFQWLADEGTPEADYLRNCKLVVSVADQSKAIALRKPEVVAPLTVDVTQGVASCEYKVHAVPRSAKLWLEITRLSDAFPAHTFSGGRRLRSSGKTTVKLTSASQAELFSLHILFSASRRGTVTVSARPIGTNGKLFDAKKIGAELAALQSRKQIMEAQFQALPSRNRTLAKPQFDREMAALDARIAYCLELEEVCQRLRDGGAIHFRVFASLGDRELTLLTTEQVTETPTEQRGSS